MFGIDRYILKQLAVGMVLVTIGLTAILWLTQSLRFVELTVNKGASIGTFLQLTVLVMPNFLTVILPVALFTVTLFTYNKLISDRELVVLRAAGLSHWALARPAMILAVANVGLGLLLNLWIIPKSVEEFHKLQFALKSTATGVLLQEGQFVQVGKGLTVYVRARNPRGELLGLIIHDHRNPQKIITILAERGALIPKENASPTVALFNGTREQVTPGSSRLSLLSFERDAIEFTDDQDSDQERIRDARERSTGELFGILATDVTPSDYRKFRVEGHQRLAAPLYHLAFATLAAACLLCGWFNRRGQSGRLVLAIALMVLMQAMALGASNLATGDLMWLPLMYALPILCTIIAAWLLTAPRLPSFGRKDPEDLLMAE
jgi:lipopolysaccharide export system permease protein